MFDHCMNGLKAVPFKELGFFRNLVQPGLAGLGRPKGRVIVLDYVRLKPVSTLPCPSYRGGLSYQTPESELLQANMQHFRLLMET
jgi:hypothetical protein